jgi:hypothetical protein
VKPGWEKEKGGVFELETAPTLVDTAFTQNETLHALGEGIADKSPFFEADSGIGDGWKMCVHGGSLRWEGRIRKNAAFRFIRP